MTSSPQTLVGGGFEAVWAILQGSERFMSAQDIIGELGPEGASLWQSARQDPRFEGSVILQGQPGSERYQTLAQAASRIAHMLRVTGQSMSREAICKRLKFQASDAVWGNIVKRLRFHNEVEEEDVEGVLHLGVKLPGADTLFDPRFHNQSRPADRLAGTMLAGRYEVLSELGRGGMGVVYKARQLNLGTPVAIKVVLTQQGLAPDVLDNMIARFEQEMWLLARLNHPNIVKLYDAGQLPSGDLYTVLEFIEGKPLEDLIGGQPIPARQAYRLMRQVANVLHHGHQGGVVHRDLKPANIMVTDPGPFANAMVLDFGIATIHEPDQPAAPTDTQLDALDDDTQASKLTQAGQVLGTPHYMAPEQIHGNSSPQVDIYAWGLVLFECLTGYPAYQGSLGSIFRHKLEATPLTLPDTLTDHILAPIITRAIAANPDERYPSTTELLEDLAKINPNALETSHTSPSRPLWPIATALALGLGAGLALGLALG